MLNFQIRKDINLLNRRSQIITAFLICILGVWILGFSFSSAEVNQDSVSKKRAELEAELGQLETQIAGYRQTITEKQKESTTFERDIAILNAKIQKSLLEIKARKIAIDKLTENIVERSASIENLAGQIDSRKISLAEFIRRINELDETSLVELILKYDNLSEFFGEFDTYDSIQAAMQDSLGEIRDIKTTTEKERKELENHKIQETELKSIQEMEKKRIEENKTEKNQLLKTTKGEEKKYQTILNERQKKAAQIRSQLFLLRGSPAIPFEKALNHANIIFKELGIRPAFLLGVVAEESELCAGIG